MYGVKCGFLSPLFLRPIDVYCFNNFLFEIMSQRHHALFLICRANNDAVLTTANAESPKMHKVVVIRGRDAFDRVEL